MIIVQKHLWQYYRDEPDLNNYVTIFNFPSDSASVKFKQGLTDKTRNNGKKC